MSGNEFHSFTELIQKRIEKEKETFFENPTIQKAYFIGAYSKAVINSSWNSDVSKGNTTFKNWLSNQIINYRNLDRIFEMAFRFEQKLKLRIRNNSEVRVLAHEVPVAPTAGISNSKISFAFVAGFDDYSKFCNMYPTDQSNTIDHNKN